MYIFPACLVNKRMIHDAKSSRRLGNYRKSNKPNIWTHLQDII